MMGIFSGLVVMMLITPPTASLPYNVDEGPLIISTLSTSEVGIPLKP